MPEDLPQRLGARVSHRRRTLGLKQNTLAEKAQVSTATVSDLEAGKINPTVETVARIAEALGVKVAVLIQD